MNTQYTLIDLNVVVFYNGLYIDVQDIMNDLASITNQSEYISKLTATARLIEGTTYSHIILIIDNELQARMDSDELIDSTLSLGLSLSNYEIKYRRVENVWSLYLTQSDDALQVATDIIAEWMEHF